jgi:hypothetical protein
MKIKLSGVLFSLSPGKVVAFEQQIAIIPQNACMNGPPTVICASAENRVARQQQGILDLMQTGRGAEPGVQKRLFRHR